MIWVYPQLLEENKDASGQIMDTAMCSKMERLRTWDARTNLITLRKVIKLDSLKSYLSNTIIRRRLFLGQLILICNSSLHII